MKSGQNRIELVTRPAPDSDGHFVGLPRLPDWSSWERRGLTWVGGGPSLDSSGLWLLRRWRPRH